MQFIILNCVKHNINQQGKCTNGTNLLVCFKCSSKLGLDDFICFSVIGIVRKLIINHKNIGLNNPMIEGKSFNPEKKNPNQATNSKNKFGCLEYFQSPWLNISFSYYGSAPLFYSYIYSKSLYPKLDPGLATSL